MADVDWMDRRVFREIEHVNEVRQLNVQLTSLILEYVLSHRRKRGSPTICSW